MVPTQSIPLRRKLILALLGMTKSGKTTSISALTEHPEQIISMSNGDNGRTKVTVEYHLVENIVDAGIVVEEIEFYEQAILKSPDGSSKDDFNSAVRTDSKIYKNILKLREVTEDEQLKYSVICQLNNLKDKLKTLDDIKALITTENIDQYVKKVTLCVQMNAELRDCISDIDLYIRDTRGFMDIALEKDEDGTKKLTNVRPLSEIGLDGIHGAVFFSSDDYPNIVSSIYEDTIKTIFRSVPFFLVARDKAFSKLFRLNSQPETLENVKAFIHSIQDGSSLLYTDIEAEFFVDTLRLLNVFSVTKRTEDGEYQFIDPYFKQPETEFLLSFCTAFRRTQNIPDILSNPDFQFYQKTVIVSFVQMVKKVCSLLDSMYEVLRSGIVSNILMHNYTSFVHELQSDLHKYNNYHTSSNASSIVKPQLTYLTEKEFGRNLVDPNYAILGKYRGITTLSNGKLKHASTAVLCVTARKSLMETIDRIHLTGDLLDANGAVIMSNLKGDYKKQESLLKIALRYVLYQQFTDVNATVQHYLIVNRYEAKKAIEDVRTRGIASTSAVLESVRVILDEFCATLQNIKDIESLFTNR